jgi:hypothetical protein
MAREELVLETNSIVHRSAAWGHWFSLVDIGGTLRLVLGKWWIRVCHVRSPRVLVKNNVVYFDTYACHWPGHSITVAVEFSGALEHQSSGV